MLKYVYRVKGRKCSYFCFTKDFVLNHLKSSKIDDDKKLLNYIHEQNLDEIIDSLQIPYSYRMRYVILESSTDMITSYFCPYCESEFDGKTLIHKKYVHDEGPLNSGEQMEYFCPNNHRVLRVRIFVS